MKQRSLGDTGFQSKRDKRTRKQIFLEEMNKGVPWNRVNTLPFYMDLLDQLDASPFQALAKTLKS